MKQSERTVYEYLKGFDGAIPPSVREICLGTGIKSTSTVHRALNSLCERGLIDRERKFARGIRIRSDGYTPPVFSSVADYISGISSGVFDISEKKELFALKIRSSKEFNGLDAGDILLLERTDKAQNGDIVIVNIGRQTLLRRFEKSTDGYFTLTNDASPLPMVVSEMQIIAVARGVYRKFN